MKSAKQLAKAYFMEHKGAGLKELMEHIAEEGQKSPLGKQLALGLMEALEEQGASGKGLYAFR